MIFVKHITCLQFCVKSYAINVLDIAVAVRLNPMRRKWNWELGWPVGNEGGKGNEELGWSKKVRKGNQERWGRGMRNWNDQRRWGRGKRNWSDQRRWGRGMRNWPPSPSFQNKGAASPPGKFSMIITPTSSQIGMDRRDLGPSHSRT